MEYTKNSNPNHYIEHEYETNCGSYALRIQEWYEVDFDMQVYALQMKDEGADDEEIYWTITDEATILLLYEFENELRQLTGADDFIADNEELIAFRISLETWDDYGADFHFRVFRGGKWMEKCGCQEVRECEFEEDSWETGLIYEGPIVYFAHQIS